MSRPPKPLIERKMLIPAVESSRLRRSAREAAGTVPGTVSARMRNAFVPIQRRRGRHASAGRTLEAMARLARRELPDGLHHVTSRAVRRLPLFVSERDALALLSLVDHVTGKTARWKVLAYCLMPNHFHLVVEAEIAELSIAMHRVNGLYAQRFNREHGYRGHLFQGRFHATPILTEGHLPESVRYVLLNPVRAGLCERPEHWRWSSYRASIALASSPRFLSHDRLASALGTTPADVQEVLREFVESALPAQLRPGTVPGTVPPVPPPTVPRTR